MEPDGDTVATPIADLRPSLDQLSTRVFTAVVTLVWPYSSVSQRLSLLLSDPDSRLRSIKGGQVRVHFESSAAEEVVRLRISNGDCLTLSLDGSQWSKQTDTAGIFGNCLDWELSYSTRLRLKAEKRSGLTSVVDLRPQPSPERRPTQTPARPESPPPHIPQSDWASPAFTKRLAEFTPRKVSIALPPTQEEDGYIPGIGRKRPKFGRPSGEWTFIEAPASPIASPHSFADELEAAISRSPTPLGASELLVPSTTQSGTPNSRTTPKESEPPVEAPIVVDDGGNPTFATEDVNASETAAGHAVAVGLRAGLLEQPPNPATGNATGYVAAAGGTNYAAVTLAPHAPDDSDVPTRAGVVAADGSGASSHAFESLTAAVNSVQPNLYLSATNYSPELLGDTVPASTDWSSGVNQPVMDQAFEDAAMSEQAYHAMMLAAAQSEFPDHMPSTRDAHIAPASFATLEAAEMSAVSEAEAATPSSSRSLQQVAVLDDQGSRSSEFLVGETRKDASSTDVDEPHDRRQEGEPADMEGEESASELEDEEDDSTSSYDSDQERSDAEVEEEEEDSISNYDNDEQRSDAEAEFDGHEEQVSLSEYDEEAEDEESDSYDSEETPRQRASSEAAHTGKPITSEPSQVIVLDSDSEDDEDTLAPSAANRIDVREQPSATPVPDDGLHEGAEAQPSDSPDSSERDATSLSSDAEQSTAEPSKGDIANAHPHIQTPAESSIGARTLGIENIEADDHEYAKQVASSSQRDVPSWDVEAVSEAQESSDSEGEGEGADDDGADARSDSACSSDVESGVSSPDAVDSLPEVANDYQEASPSAQNVLGAEATDIGPPETVPTALVQADNTSEGDAPITLVDDDCTSIVDNHDNPMFSTDASPELIITDGIAQVLSSDHQPTESVGRLIDVKAESDLSCNVSKDVNVAGRGYGGPAASLQDQSTPLSRSPSPSMQLHREMLAFSRLTAFEQQLHRSKTTHASIETETHGQDLQVDMDSERLSDYASKDFDEGREIDSTLSLAGDDVSFQASAATDLPGLDSAAQGLRSPTSYYSPLATLERTVGTQVNTMCVVFDANEIEAVTAQSYQISLEVTEPSMSGIAVPVVIIDSPSRDLLPSVRKGDVVLLRDFVVATVDTRLGLTSSEASAWAVFRQADGTITDVQVNGRSVEYGTVELDHANRLREWFTEEGLALAIKQSAKRDASERFSTPMENASVTSSLASSQLVEGRSASLAVTPRSSVRKPRARTRSLREKDRRITIHKMRYGRQYTEVGSPPAKHILHELRDGTTWSDI